MADSAISYESVHIFSKSLPRVFFLYSSYSFGYSSVQVRFSIVKLIKGYQDVVLVRSFVIFWQTFHFISFSAKMKHNISRIGKSI